MSQSQIPLQVIADPYVAAARYFRLTTSGFVVDSLGNTISMLSTSVSATHTGWTRYTYVLSGIFYLPEPRTIVRIEFRHANRPVIVLANFNLQLGAGYHLFAISASITNQTAYTTLGT